MEETIGQRTRAEEFRALVDYFDRNPELLKKQGFESTGQLVEAALKGLKMEKPVEPEIRSKAKAR